jgi:biopolymer transport protein ExbB/TolQ
MSLENSLMELMVDGGWVRWWILALSLASVAVTVERSWALWRARSPVGELTSTLRRHLGSSTPAGDPAAALGAVRRIDGAAGRVLAAGLDRFASSPARIEAAMKRRGEAELREREEPVVRAASS